MPRLKPPPHCFPASRLLHAFFLALATYAEDASLRDVVEHGLKQAPVTPAQDPITAGLCVKDAGRSCKGVTQTTIVDHVAQCITGSHTNFFGVADTLGDTAGAKNYHQAYCSADVPPVQPTGSCICGPGFCSDIDQLCHKGTYRVLEDVFTISTKDFPAEKLYMTADGKVHMGIPPDPRASQWRVSVTKKGVKMLWTEMYTTTVLQEYETCTTLTDAYGLPFTNCEKIVGHIANPRANEMGWYIDMHHSDNKLPDFGLRPKPGVQLRSAISGNMFYISPLSKEGTHCELRGRNCPGNAGLFVFDPPLVGRTDFDLDFGPGFLPPGLVAYTSTVIVAAFLICCLGCVYATNPDGYSCVTSLLLIPFQQCSRSWGLNNMSHGYIGGKT